MSLHMQVRQECSREHDFEVQLSDEQVRSATLSCNTWPVHQCGCAPSHPLPRLYPHTQSGQAEETAFVYLRPFLKEFLCKNALAPFIQLAWLP